MNLLALLACRSPGPEPDATLVPPASEPAPETAWTVDDPGNSPAEPDEGPDTADPAPTGCAAYAEPVATGTVADSALDELSDLVPSRTNPGVLWTHEDSGGDAALYALDPSGATLGTLTITGASNRDWEDLAVAPCPDGGGDCLWIGDTGDNGLSRDDVAVLVVPEPVVTGTFTAAADPVTYRYAFPDGRGNVEGLAVDPSGLPILVTKRVDGTADVYRFPTLDPTTTVTLDRVGRITTGDPADEHTAEATSADLRADHLLVRTYGFLLEYPMEGGIPGEPVGIPAPDEVQGEAAGYDAEGGVWLVSEGAAATLWYVGCAG